MTPLTVELECYSLTQTTGYVSFVIKDLGLTFSWALPLNGGEPR
jgi:hypothetical protein